MPSYNNYLKVPPHDFAFSVYPLTFSPWHCVLTMWMSDKLKYINCETNNPVNYRCVHYKSYYSKLKFV